MSRNLSIVVDSEFKNRSFDDLLKPLALYTTEYNAQEEALGDLATKANVWEGMADQEKDPIAYAQYKRYADSLRNQAKLLSSTGLNPSSKMDLLNLKRRYASEIAPIEQAYASRKAQADEQRKALLQNPTLLLSRRADMTSLDDYLKNQQLGYESYSGALLTQQVSQAAKAIAKELKAYGNGKRLDAFTKTWLQQHGVTSAEVAYAINHPDSPKSNKVLNTIIANVMSDSGIANWADRATLKEAYSYARQGLWDAVGQTEVREYKDTGAEIAAREASQRRLAKEAAAAQAAQRALLQKPHINPTNLYSMKEYNKARDNIKKYKDYFTQGKDGKYYLNAKGWQEYHRKYNAADFKPFLGANDLLAEAYRPIARTVLGGLPLPSDVAKRALANEANALIKAGKLANSKLVTTIDSPFKTFMDSLGANKYVSNTVSGARLVSDGNGWFGKNMRIGTKNSGTNHAAVGDLWSKYIDSHNDALYDATKDTEYVLWLDTDTQKKDMLNKIVVAAKNNPIDEVDFDSKSRSFKPTGNTLDAKTIKKSTLGDLRISSFGDTFMLIGEDGDVHRYQMPNGIDTRAQASTQNALNRAVELENILVNGAIPNSDGSSTPLSPADALVYQQLYEQTLAEAHSEYMKTATSNKAKPTEYGASEE